MLIAIVVILGLLWLLGYGPLQILSVPLFNFNRETINLWHVLIFLVMLWLIGALPRPFREIASVLFVIWILSVLGIIALAGLSNILVISIIVGLVIYIISGR